MKAGLLHLVNIISDLLPQTRCFGIRRRLFAAVGVAIARSARINGRVRFQYRNVSIGSGTWIGARTEFAATRSAAIVIGADCDVSQDVLFLCGTHEVGPSSRRAGEGRAAPILIGDGTWVGARATFLGGSRVGTGCIVAAGSVVRGEFGDNIMLAGVPAKMVKRLSE